MKKILTLFFLSACATQGNMKGSYAGHFELPVSDQLSCHFLMKKAKPAVPTILCHDSIEGWAVPLTEFGGHKWVLRPAVTESGTLLAYLENVTDSRTQVLVSTNQGKNWDIYPVFEKKQASDLLLDVSIDKRGRLIATYKDATKEYKAEQAASFRSKFSPIKQHAKSYPKECFEQHLKGSETKVSPECLSGYLQRLLK